MFRPITESLLLVAGCTCALQKTGCTFISLNSTVPPYEVFATTFTRTLIVPGFTEEFFWRKLLLGPKASLMSPRSLAVNSIFAVSHIVGGRILIPYRPGAESIFSSPAFLSLAWILGMACTHAYIRTGRNLIAPIFVHSSCVTIWLTCLGGDLALSAVQ